MTRQSILQLIERNSGQTLEESSKNGIMAHSVDVDGFIDDLLEALKKEDETMKDIAIEAMTDHIKELNQRNLELINALRTAQLLLAIHV
jgi:hypothetical protein